MTFKDILAKAKAELLDLVTLLNTFGSTVLAYALQNQGAANEALAFIPPTIRPIAALVLPGAWWLLVQFAKARVIRKAQAS